MKPMQADLAPTKLQRPKNETTEERKTPVLIRAIKEIIRMRYPKKMKARNGGLTLNPTVRSSGSLPMYVLIG